MKHKDNGYWALALITQLGISMMVPVFLCVWAGSFLEEKYGWPVSIPLLILGMLAGARNVYMLVKHAGEDSQDEKEEEDE